MDKNKIISEFNLKPFGQKGWLRGNLSCPECERNDKFAVLFTDSGAVVHCFYCSISLPLWKQLKTIGRKDLLSYSYDFEEKATLPSLTKETKEEDTELVELPIGYRRICFDQYLEDRGFTKEQYEQFKVGKAELDPRTEGKITFEIWQKGKLCGWLARSKESKEWHHNNLKQHKEKKTPLVLRYRCSDNNFSKMLGGLDEITENTHTLILVEGVFDKANLDRIAGLNSQEEVKCCFTFGGDLKIEQVNIIPKHIETIILMYDPGTISNMREAGSRLMSFFQVKVALIKDEGIDPGNMTQNYLSQLFLNLQDYLYFYSSIYKSKK